MLPKSKFQAMSLLVAVAVAGFAAGAATMSRADTRKPTDPADRCSYSGRLRDELGLSTTQRDSIHALMNAGKREMRTAFAPVQPAMDSLRAKMRDRIRAVLTTEQRVRYDSMMAREHARWDSAAPGRNSRTGTR